MTTSLTQKNKIELLLSDLNLSEANSSKVDLLNKVGWAFAAEAKFHSSKEYLFEAEVLARKLCYNEGLADSMSFLGRVAEYEGRYVQSLEYQHKSIKIRQEVNDKKGLSYSLHYLGDIYLSQSSLTDNSSAKLEFSNTALEQFYRSLEIAEEIKDQQSIANTYNCIGNSYREQNDTTRAVEYYSRALQLREELGDVQGFAVTYNNLGKLYIQQGNYSQALEHLSKALTLAEELGDVRTIIKVLGSIGECCLKAGRYEQALETSKRSLLLATKINLLEFIVSANHTLSQIYESENFESRNMGIALNYFKEYIKGRDTISTNKLIQAELNFEFDKKIAATKAEQDKKDAIAAIIEKKNQELLESINYALLIQQAILPLKKDIAEALPDALILYLPKHIVSGDFYFLHRTGSSTYIAAADCTGHGVPGALMSMIGYEKLKDAVQKSGHVGTALSLLNKGIKYSLKQTDSEKSTRDGMDIALCSIDTLTRTVKYSGANRPLWLFRNGSPNCEEIKATKTAIGGFTEDAQYFETHELQLQPGDTFYLFTDGYADTFSTEDKKLTTRKFRELLIEIQGKSMLEQEQHLHTFIQSWKGETEQMDDILVIGVRL